MSPGDMEGSAPAAAPASPERKTAETQRDGIAAAAAHARLPRRKRYTMNLDLDAESPADAEENAPMAPLDL
jgi:hypothetical protein